LRFGSRTGLERGPRETRGHGHGPLRRNNLFCVGGRNPPRGNIFGGPRRGAPARRGTLTGETGGYAGRRRSVGSPRPAQVVRWGRTGSQQPVSGTESHTTRSVGSVQPVRQSVFCPGGEVRSRVRVLPPPGRRPFPQRFVRDRARVFRQRRGGTLDLSGYIGR